MSLLRCFLLRNSPALLSDAALIITSASLLLMSLVELYRHGSTRHIQRPSRHASHDPIEWTTSKETEIRI